TGHPNGVLPTRSIGNYVTYQPYNGRGIREFPYTTDMTKNPATFGYVKRPDYSETHSVGFVWCTMLYEMMQGFIDKYGMNDNVYEGANPITGPDGKNMPPSSAKGNNIATRLVIEAMKLQQTSPTFIQERDAILKADSLLYSGRDVCDVIWKAFAKRGLGFSAVSGTNALGDEVEAFDVPLACDPSQKRVRIEKSAPIKALNNAAVAYTIKVTNLLAFAADNVVISDTLINDLAFQNGTVTKGTLAQSGQIVTWTLNLAARDTAVMTINTILSSANASTLVFGDDQEGATTSFIPANMGGVDTWTKKDSASQAYSGSRYWFAPDTDLGGSNTTLTTSNPISVVASSTLVFIHKFATEVNYDGGVVEVSTDNTNWSYLPANKFIKGSYNGSIPTANNPSIGTSDLAAFSGASNGYMVSIAKLEDYAGKAIYIRFRFTSDVGGGSVTNGGWWLDDVYVLNNLTQITNSAVAITTTNAPVSFREGTNASSSSSSFVLDNKTLASNLGSLTAVTSGQSIKVSWKTFSELNTSTFVVERKAPAQTDFIKIGEVAAAGNSNSTKEYSFSDNTVTSLKKYQYRIKEVSKSGEFMYTNIAVIQFGALEFKASVYPNPADNVVNLSIVNPAANKITINVFDGIGKKLFTLNGGNSESNLISIPVTYLKPGTYYIEVNSDDNHTTLHFIKK
ncbi:MAG: M36 family metallopeptidase, partial [Bacteroidota bacterium]|nr:M36 family metallopeptidase [Bacteroidota bacterium]